MNETIERHGETLTAVDPRELTAVEGGLNPENCGTCRNPLNPSQMPPWAPMGTPSPFGGVAGFRPRFIRA